MEKKKGQALTEYLILVCLIAVAAVGVLSVLGQNLRARFAVISSTIRGEKNTKTDFAEPSPEDLEMKGFDLAE